MRFVMMPDTLGINIMRNLFGSAHQNDNPIVEPELHHQLALDNKFRDGGALAAMRFAFGSISWIADDGNDIVICLSDNVSFKLRFS